jgi:hypothetical protein
MEVNATGSKVTTITLPTMPKDNTGRSIVINYNGEFIKIRSRNIFLNTWYQIKLFIFKSVTIKG